MVENSTAGRWIGAALMLTAWLASAGSAHAAACTTGPSSLKGWYAMLVAGDKIAAGTSKYQVGAALFDGVSAVSGSNVYYSGGGHSAVTGSYLQNADCTFTVTLTVGTATVSSTSTYNIALKSTGEAVGIETDAAAVSTISFKPQYAAYTPSLSFIPSAVNGTYAAICAGPLTSSSDLNLATFNNGIVTGTDPYNNGGSTGIANVPYTGTYTVNSDGTFAGKLSVLSTPFDFYGVIGNANSQIEYIYTNVAKGVPTTAFASCTGGVAPAAATAVNLAPYFNSYALFTDGTAVTHSGLGGGYSYSANLLGYAVTWAGLVFPLGPANGPSAVANAKVTLPAGNFSTLDLLGTATYGPQTGTFIVTYTDGTTTSFSQGMSDWGLAYNGTLSHFAGESIAASMPYRGSPSGGAQTGPWYLYGYSFALNNTKTVASVTLPASTTIYVLSALLQP